jgi:hypothetical protein
MVVFRAIGLVQRNGVERNSDPRGTAHGDLEAIVQYDFELQLAIDQPVERAAVRIGNCFGGGEDGFQ